METKPTITEKEVIDVYNRLLELKGQNQEYLTPEQMTGVRIGLSIAMGVAAYKLLGKVIIDHVKL
jgi:hypothetical protein